MVKKKLVHDTEDEMKYLREGLNEIVQPSSLLMLSAQDIALALSGNCDLDVSEVFPSYFDLEISKSQFVVNISLFCMQWQQCTDVIGFRDDNPQPSWFWSHVSALSPSSKLRHMNVLLFFPSPK